MSSMTFIGMADPEKIVTRGLSNDEAYFTLALFAQRIYLLEKIERAMVL